MINQKVREHIISIIEDMRDMTIITFRDANCPESAIVNYVNDGFTIYCETKNFIKNEKKIDKKDRAFVIINHCYKKNDDIESLSIDAIAHMTEDKNEIEKVSELMVKKFPEIKKNNPSWFHNTIFYRIEPRAISLLDNNKGLCYLEYVPF